MQESENGLKKAGKKKRKDQDGKERPEYPPEQQERDKKEQQKIAEDKRAEGFFGLGFRL